MCLDIEGHEEEPWEIWLGLVVREGSDSNNRPRFILLFWKVKWKVYKGVLLLSFILTGIYWTSGYPASE